MVPGRIAAYAAAAFVLPVVIVSCSQRPSIDWAVPENFFVVEKSERTNEGARMEFHSLVDAPAADVYHALADVEHYATFVTGVSESDLLHAEDDTKTIRITQAVIGRQSHAEVKWTLHPQDLRLAFETLKSDANFNDGEYRVVASPDGKRCYVISIFHVKEKGAAPNVPIGVLEAATRDSFENAARSIKVRALGARR